MKIEAIYENIELTTRLDEEASLPLFIQGKERVWWFTFYLDADTGMCFSTRVYSCNLDGEDPIYDYFSYKTDIDFSSYDIKLDDINYSQHLPEVKSIEELIILIKKTEGAPYLNLYIKIIEEYLK